MAIEFKTVKDASDLVFVNQMPLEDIAKINTIHNQKSWYVLDEIGSGAFGNVYTYTGVNGVKYAIKVFKGYGEDDQRRDGETLQEFNGCRYFPKVYYYFSGQFVVMEKIDGYTINKVRNDPYECPIVFLKKEEYKYIAYELAYELASKGFFMGDTHGHNMMIRKDGTPVLIDMGMYGKKIGPFYLDFFRASYKDAEEIIYQTYANAADNYNRHIERLEERIKRDYEFKKERDRIMKKEMSFVAKRIPKSPIFFDGKLGDF